MYGLPPGFDPEIFLGRVVDQVCFSANNVQISFRDDGYITIEGSYAHLTHEAADTPDVAVPPSSSNLMRLAGKVVSAASVVGSGDLRLVFDDGQILVCLDDSPKYESYHIGIDGFEITV